MSCNGCRVLRKGCSENCILRPCLQSIESPDSQGHATVFVAKFFGRAGLMSFISAVPESQRPALFQSLLFEAAGRTVNPVNGAVGLLWTGNWHVCQAAVETILRGGTLRPMQEIPPLVLTSDDSSEVECAEDGWMHLDVPLAGPNYHCRFSNSRSKASLNRKKSALQTGPCPGELDLRLSPGFIPEVNFRPGTPSMNSEEESVTTTFNNNNFVTCYERHVSQNPYAIRSNKLLNLFP